MSHQRVSPAARDPDLSDLSTASVEEVLRALSAALRSYRLYEGSNPMLDRFVTSLQQKFRALWEEHPLLRLGIEEDRIIWENQIVLASGDSGTDLPFLFYKDGIRELTFLPGFEDDEAIRFLGVLARAPSIRSDEDDLITLLWQEDLSKLRYEVVEASEEGVELPTGGNSSPAAVDSAAVRDEASGRTGITADDFQETLYFLDEAELRRLRDEIKRESERDLWRDVLNALLDRLEDGSEERQLRIVTILGELLPSALATAEFGRAASLLEQVVDAASRPGVVAPPAIREIRALFDHLGADDTVTQLAEILEEMPDRLAEDAVLRLLGYFPPRSIAPLMRATERIQRPEVRRAFDACVQRLAEGNRDEVVALLRSDDPAVLASSLNWIGRLEIGSAVGEIGKFLRHSDVGVRVAAVGALVAVRAATSANAVIPLLEDEQREVRIAAARALGSLGFTAAAPALESALASKRLREADRGEKIAFFEAFGRLSGEKGVPVLDRILNSRNWLGRGEAAEVRACAALGLAKIRHPSARASLEAAAGDSDPVVRAAVARAIRGEAG